MKQNRLQILENQLNQIKKEILLSDSTKKSTHLFDSDLFSEIDFDEKNPLLTYFNETKIIFQNLKNALQKNQLELADFLSKKLVFQVAAIKREIATKNVRQKNENYYFFESKIQKKVRFSNYLNRLNEMKKKEEKKLMSIKFPLDKIQIEKVIEKLNARILRCEKAIEHLK